MKFLSLFDGCHMFGHALRNVGADCVGTSEIDRHAAAVTSYHYPETPALGDVHNVESTDADIIVAGFPCQDLSVAGNRRGLAGERSGLFWEIVRIARESSPRWLLLENVPGLLSSNGGRDMGAVLGALGELGYGWAYRVLNAQHFGVPQRRRRVFIVGCLGSSRRAAKVLFEPESVRGDSPPSRETGKGFAGGAGSGVSVGGDISHTLTGNGGCSEDGTGRGTPIVAGLSAGEWPKQIAPTLDAHFGSKQGLEDQHINSEAGLFVASSHGMMRESGHAGTLRAQGGDVGGGSEVLVADMAQITSAADRSNPKPGDMAPTLAATSRAVAVSLRGRHGGSVAELGGAVSHALRASQGGGDKPHALTGGGVRRLMPIECERLQGLPGDWTKHGRKPDGSTYEQSDSARYKMIGNGGAVPVVEWIGRRIMKQEARA